MIKHLIVFFLSVSIFSCKSIDCYHESDRPVFLNRDINQAIPTEEKDTIVVITFNANQNADHTQSAVELSKLIASSDLDILLLQEVDEKSTLQFAKILDLNYLYYPICQSTDESNFGNAILTKHHFTQEEKLVLPSQKMNGRIRNATNAIINVNGYSILVYSIHNETIAMSKKKRIQQFNAIIEDIRRKKKSHDIVLAGGDFNTITKRYKDFIVNSFRDQGLHWITEDNSYTASEFTGLLKFSLDHIFGSNVTIYKTKVLYASQSSDHKPVVAYLGLKNLESK